MNNNLKTILIAALTAAIGYFTGTNTSPSVEFKAAGADFTISYDGSKACISFEKNMAAEDAQALVDSLLPGNDKSGNFHLQISPGHVGGFNIKGEGCVDTN